MRSVGYLRLRSPLPKQSCAEADIGCAQRNGILEIGAHAHAKVAQTVPVCQLFQQREMRRGRLVNRRNAHQAAYSELQFPAMCEKIRQAARRNRSEDTLGGTVC